MDGEENIENNTNIPNVSNDCPIGYSTSIAALRTINKSGIPLLLSLRVCQ